MTTTQVDEQNDVKEKLKAAGASRIFSFLSRHTVAVRVTASAAPNQRMIREATVQVGGVTVDKADVKSPCLILVPQEVTKKLNQIAGYARRLPQRYGVPFIELAYLVPIADGGDESPIAKLFEEVTVKCQEYTDAAEQLWPDYQKRCEELRKRPDLLEFDRYLLDKDDWMAHHVLRCSTFPLAGLSPDFSKQVADAIRTHYPATGGNARAIHDAADELGSLADTVAAGSSNMSFMGNLQETGKWAKMANDAAAKMASEAATEMVKAPINEMIESLQSFETILSKGGTVRKDSLLRVREAYDKLRGFDFVLPESYRTRLNVLGHRLEQASVTTLSGAANANAAMAFSQYLQGIRNDLLKGEESNVALGAVACMIEEFN